MAAFDVIVIGLGVMGASAVDALTRRGLDVLGIDRFGPGHVMGASHGRSRVFRLSQNENPAYVPLMRRSLELWRDLERRTHERLLTVTGTLEIGRTSGSDVVEGALKSVREHGLMHEVLDREEIARRYPVFDIPNSYSGVWQPEGGFLAPERVVHSYHRLAAEGGARLHFGERVTGLEPKADHIVVVTDEGRYECGQVVIAAGAWVAKLVPDLLGVARTTRQVTGWFWPKTPMPFSAGRLPVFIIDDGVMGAFYGIPVFEDGGMKIARHGHLNEIMDPDGLRLPVNDRDVVILRSFLSRRVPLLDGEPVRTETCVYTNMPDGNFLIDWLPQDSRILTVSACSGHGFKFASAIGQIVGDLLTTGSTSHQISSFGFGRLPQRQMRR